MNDSICFTCDTIIVKMDKMVAFLQPIQQSKTTNLMDVFIAVAVCIALVLIALIVLRHITEWKKDKLNEEKEKRNAETIKEEKDKKFKLMNDYQAKLLDYKKNELDDYEKLINKLSELIDKNSKDNPTDETVLQSFKEGLDTIKNHNSSAKAAYVTYLEQCIKELKGKELKGN